MRREIIVLFSVLILIGLFSAGYNWSEKYLVSGNQKSVDISVFKTAIKAPVYLEFF
jgi:predicted permease